MKLLLLSIALVAVAVLLLSFKVLLVKGSKFPSGHVHDNPELRKRGMACHRDTDGVTRPVNAVHKIDKNVNQPIKQDA